MAADPASQTPAGQAYDPPAGHFQWDAGYPATLHELWSPDQANVLLRGAVMAFESQHNMTIDGSLTPQLWKALFRAEASGDTNQIGYTYAIANKGSPETLTIWHDGREVLRSLANTGIPVSPTVDGTFPVYERFRYTIMSGTNPDGSHYSDPVSVRLLLQRRRRGALLPARLLRLPAEPGLRRAALRRGSAAPTRT